MIKTNQCERENAEEDDEENEKLIKESSLYTNDLQFDKTYYIEIEIGTRKVKTLIDTGSDINLLCEKMIQKNIKIRESNLVIKMADNKRLKIEGKVKLSCVVDRNEYLVDFILVKDMPQIVY